MLFTKPSAVSSSLKGWQIVAGGRSVAETTGCYLTALQAGTQSLPALGYVKTSNKKEPKRRSRR
jgi:hypothetical protein